MAMFKAFKPSGMEKIARAMGYQGNMQGFQDYLAQDPMRQQQMQNYQQKAMQMARGGVVKMQTGGLSKQPYQQNYQSAPMYDQFKQSDYYKNMPMVGAMVTGGATIDGQTYNFPMAMQANAYKDYMRSLGGYQVGREMPVDAFPQPITKPAANTGSVAPGTPNPNTRVPMGMDEQATKFGQFAPGTPNITSGDYRGIPFDPNDMRTQEALNVPSGQPLSGRQQPLGLIGTVASAQPDYSGMTYGQAVARQSARDVKSPEEAAAIQAALARGPQSAVGDGLLFPPIYERPGPEGFFPLPPQPNQPLTQAYVPPQEFKKVTKPKMDTNEFLADGETPNPNYMKPVTDAEGNVITEEVAPTIADVSAQMMQRPGLPTGAAVTAQGINTTDRGQMIDPSSGQVYGAAAVPTAMATTSYAQAPQESEANVMQATQAAPAVSAALNATQAAQGTVSPEAQVLAAQQTASSVGDVNAAQGNAILMDNPVQREIQQGELISGAADAQTAAQFTEQVQAAEATPSKQATVQGQLDGLMQQFEGGETPAWAAGAMRAATQAMASRGLGASSIAGQAIVQAAMESALPVAQADASIFAQFEQQNLSNRQQRTMLAAQQRAQFMGQEFDQAFQARVANAARIGDIANMNFTAEQQVALENSRIANSMNLANLSNNQAVVMAEAAALSNLDMANLSNRQQSAVMNAQNFMQMDMANLSNQQQTDIFKAQQRIQSLFTDQAATNAAAQFNASSQNQVDQFFANLSNNVSQFNATQANAQSQYNAGQRNVVERFNAELNNQRDQFNAQNRLVIDQSNAQWRRQVATADTAAINRANELNANALLGISNQAYNNMWQYYGDSMEWAWTSAENERSRVVNLAIEQLRADSQANIQAMMNDYNSSVGFGNLIGTFLTASSSSVVGSLFGL